ncbi:RNA-guided endonuclease InsQ/TnpB family protein [Nocardia macrotermitis]|uniref:RNA-guided endonuclease InsQ/TnpB family protein n=1 Tax=Nocardia macrotermitis TaxID=2585198 RepID=UPI0029E80428|nr:transposase [Nocardia macrotermitis]
MIETVRYNYRIRPGVVAARELIAESHRCRFVWNEAVHQDKSWLKPTFSKLSKLLTAARRRNSWLREGSQVAQQQTLRTYARALDESFKIPGRRRPKFKSRKTSHLSLEYTRRGFRLRDGRLCLPKGLSVPVVWSRELPSQPTSVRIFQDSLGAWYASFVVQRESEPLPTVSDAIGIDWGIRTTATTTDSAHDLPYRGYRKRCAAELARAQRRMTRRHRHGAVPSRGYRRAKHEVARLRKKAARQSSHDARVWAKRVVVAHQIIAVEDFRPGFLAKSSMARKAADAAIGQTKRELIVRAVRAGRTVVLVQPAHTTVTCSRCFARTKQHLDLGTRTFLCTECSHTECRDRNAARVILAVAERGHTCVDDVRHLQPSSAAVVGAV